MSRHRSSPPPTALPAWAALRRHAAAMRRRSLRGLFAADPDRFARFSLRLDDLLVDFSKQRITAETMDLLRDLARQAGVAERRAAQFAGEHVNVTEDRAALHMALRNAPDRPMAVDGRDVMPDVTQVLERMESFVAAVRDGAWRGAGGKLIADVVNIGIGGSDLGPAMAVQALAPFVDRERSFHFVSNIDDAALAPVLARCRPETTLFVVVSKTFTTQETLANARAARTWLTAALGEAAVARHFVAVSTNREGVADFGIDPANMFGFWDWVGGRYSLWSAVGLAIALAIGFARFREFLAGGHEMDEHFRTAPLEANLPATLALLDIWNGNFLGARAHAVLPYDQNLARLPAYLQQLVMESNGKGVTADGRPVDWATAPVLFGEPGTNGQHAFYQLLHQGTQAVPADFLAAAESLTPIGEHHALLLANCLAQSAALMKGRTAAEARAGLKAQGLSGPELESALPHRVFSGGRPSTTILYRRLDPRTLGRLIALYEHKVFVEGVVWRIDSFDQWGVELGKQLAKEILPPLKGEPAARLDSSTAGLIAYLREGARR